MQTTRPRVIYQAAPVVRWGARMLGVPILLFWGWFLLAHLFSEEGLRPRATHDYVGLTALVASLAGLAVAWKWELAGGAMTLVAVLIGAFFNWQVLVFPYALIWITAVLFLACGWMSRGAAESNGPRRGFTLNTPAQLVTMPVIQT